jgi:hypothetical protein
MTLLADAGWSRWLYWQMLVGLTLSDHVTEQAYGPEAQPLYRWDLLGCHNALGGVDHSFPPWQLESACRQHHTWWLTHKHSLLVTTIMTDVDTACCAASQLFDAWAPKGCHEHDYDLWLKNALITFLLLGLWRYLSYQDPSPNHRHSSKSGSFLGISNCFWVTGHNGLFTRQHEQKTWLGSHGSANKFAQASASIISHRLLLPHCLWPTF